jgi:hypothetical protein
LEGLTLRSSENFKLRHREYIAQNWGMRYRTHTFFAACSSLRHKLEEWGAWDMWSCVFSEHLDYLNPALDTEHSLMMMHQMSVLLSSYAGPYDKKLMGCILLEACKLCALRLSA